MYNPTIGRWMTRDPLQEAGGADVYAFVNNDPINNADPDGLSPRKSVAPEVIGGARAGDIPDNLSIPEDAIEFFTWSYSDTEFHDRPIKKGELVSIGKYQYQAIDVVES